MKFAGSTKGTFGRWFCCAVFAVLMIVNVALGDELDLTQGDIVIKDQSNYSLNNVDYQLNDKEEGYVITTGGSATANRVTVEGSMGTNTIARGVTASAMAIFILPKESCRVSNSSERSFPKRVTVCL